MKDNVFQAALAGLLHDIGKLYQRAQEEGWKIPEGTEREGQPVHAAYIDQCINGIPENYRPAAWAGKYHHHPEKSPASDQTLSWITALADKLSAGEREESDEESVTPPKQLLSIFDRVGVSLKEKRKENYLPISTLELKKGAIFPISPIDPNKVADSYNLLSRELSLSTNQRIDDPETYLENLLSAMQRTCWCVPSAYYHSIPDISLYDHSRMTAALAACLVDFKLSEIQSFYNAIKQAFLDENALTGEQKKLLQNPVALLVGGDISGIQDFIYTISSTKAAKTLRGRSLYLQLLTEAVLRYVLGELGLPYTNVIYTGGGHFYLLAPISGSKKLPLIQRDVTQKLLKHHGASLYLSLGWAEVPCSGFKRGELSRYWNQMHNNISSAKLHRYQELGDKIYPSLFEPASHGGNDQTVCSVCGDESEGTTPIKDEVDKRICPLCDSFQDPLGAHLPQAKFLRLILGKPEERQRGTAFDCLAEFGMTVEMINDQNQSLYNPISLVEPKRAIDWALDDIPKGKTWLAHPTLPTVHWKRYMVTHVPQDTFDELIKKHSHGIPRLGVLRMDMDNAGNLFSEGFVNREEKDIKTLARLSTLSFQLSIFFEGWIKQIINQVGGNKDNPIYAVYSGGDDLFLIAPWHIVPVEIVKQIIDDFNAYTGGNPSLHISGGMAFIHGKYPVYQAAEDAAQALEMAKDIQGKNAFGFLGQAWKWSEFAQLREKYHLLVELVAEKDGPKSIIQVLRTLAQMTEKRTGKGKIEKILWGPFQWLGAYQLARMIDQYKKQEKIKESLVAIREDVGPFFEKIHPWGVAARWAQLFTRKESDK